MKLPDRNVYFYSAYVPEIRQGIQGLIAGVCAGSARDALRREFPATKYLNVHRVPELKGVFNEQTGNWDLMQR